MRNLLTINEAADSIGGLTPYCIRKMIKEGKLKCFKSGNKNLIPEDELNRVVFGDKPDDTHDAEPAV